MSLSSKVISYYNYDTNLDDDTPTGNDPVASSGVSVSGGVANFNGASGCKVNYGNVIQFERNAPFSISFRYNPSQVSSKVRMLVGKQKDGGNYEGYIIAINTGGALSVGLIGTNNSDIGAMTTSTFGTGTWRHVIVTYDGSGLNSGFQIYVNNTLQTVNRSGTLTANIASNVPMQVGSRDTNTTNSFEGGMNKVGFFNDVLTSDERTKLYDGGAVLLYPFPSDFTPTPMMHHLEMVGGLM